jgi:hypothetical protein
MTTAPEATAQNLREGKHLSSKETIHNAVQTLYGKEFRPVAEFIVHPSSADRTLT